MRQPAFSPLLTLHEERFLTVVSALEQRAEDVEPSTNADASALRATRARLLWEWKTARTEAERSRLIALAAALGQVKFGIRNLSPVVTADVLFQRLAETSAHVHKELALSDVYPTQKAHEIYIATIGLVDDIRRLIDSVVHIGDTQQWTNAVLGITRRMLATWDAEMPKYRKALAPAHADGAADVRFPDRDFKPAILRQLASVEFAMRELGKTQARKSTLNSETWLYRGLDAVNRFLHGVGSTVKDIAVGTLDVAGGAVKQVVSSFGIKEALLAGAVVIGGGFVAYHALAKK